MSRALIVAKNEILMLVKTKFFIVGVLLVPVMIGLSVMFQAMAVQRMDAETRVFAVIDHTGMLVAPLSARAEQYALTGEPGDDDDTPGPKFVLRGVALNGRSADDVKLELSEQVKNKTLFGYVEIQPAVLDRAANKSTVDYYTETPSYDTFPRWFQRAVTAEVIKQRFVGASLDPALAGPLTRGTTVSTLGLLAKNANGTIAPVKKVNQLQTFLLPFGLMYVLFLAVMMNAPHMMTAVVEEKMSRISEVLLASATPFEILAGKLVGIATVSIALSLVYLGGGAFAAVVFGQFDLIQPALVAWFLIFLVCAVLMFGSVFLAVGAASSDLKDAQSMMQPAMFFLLVPIFLSAVVLRSPGSTVSIVASMVPTAAPFLMLVRLALTPPPPMWQVALSLVLTIATAAFFVWAAGRIFRVGLLMQGKPPTLPELMKWIRA